MLLEISYAHIMILKKKVFEIQILHFLDLKYSKNVFKYSLNTNTHVFDPSPACRESKGHLNHILANIKDV